MKYQVWNQDEYGKGVIIATFDEYADAIKKARQLVTDANFSNSLSATEQMRNIEAYLVEIVADDKIDENNIYAGNRRGGKFWNFKVGQSKMTTFDPNKMEVNIYIGSKFAKTKDGNIETKVYLTDEKKRIIKKIDHDILGGKSIYFIVPLD
jgi:hypothetical protein